MINKKLQKKRKFSGRKVPDGQARFNLTSDEWIGIMKEPKKGKQAITEMKATNTKKATLGKKSPNAKKATPAKKHLLQRKLPQRRKELM